MSEPRRLLEDLDAPAELREALAAERRGAASWDPGPLGERVAQALSAGAPLGAGAGAGLGGSGLLVGTKALVATALVSAALGAGGHAAWTAASRPAPGLTVSATPPASTAPAPAFPAPSAPPVPQAPLESLEPQAPLVSAPPPTTAVPAKAPHPLRPAAAAPSGQSALAEELRLYERGEAALAEGHLEVAVRELKRYLTEHPRGTLRAEAELALVEALARSGRCDEAQARAQRAPAGPEGDARRAAARACRDRP